MAKSTHPLEMAFSKFDDTAERYLRQVEGSFKGLNQIPEVKQPKKRVRKNIYALTPFEKN
tara:strand:- start:323 stop:502 length:180 start_codon:yes stop_codon:yes gene_type:complete